jgi:hypothetical protein
MVVSHLQEGFKYQVLLYEWSIWFDNGPHNCGSSFLLSSLKIHWKYSFHVGLFIHFYWLMSKVVSHRCPLTWTFFSPKIFLALSIELWMRQMNGFIGKKKKPITPPKQTGESKKVHDQKL